MYSFRVVNNTAIIDVEDKTLLKDSRALFNMIRDDVPLDKNIHLILRNITYLNSESIGQCIEIEKRCRDNETNFEIILGENTVLGYFETLGFTSFLNIRLLGEKAGKNGQ